MGPKLVTLLEPEFVQGLSTNCGTVDVAVVDVDVGKVRLFGLAQYIYDLLFSVDHLKALDFVARL